MHIDERDTTIKQSINTLQSIIFILHIFTLGVCEVFASVLRENGVRSTRCPYEDLEAGHVYSWSGDPTLVGDLNAMFQDVVNQAVSAKQVLKENNIW